MLVPRSLTLVVAVVSGVAAFKAIRGPDRAQYYAQAGCGNVQASFTDISIPQARTMTLCLVNFERRRHGVAPLAENQALDRAAHGQSADIVARQFYAHVNPDGVTPDQRMARAGYISPTGWEGENIVYGRHSIGSLVNTWMHSPGHRRTMLVPQFREVGIGIARGAPDHTGELRAAMTITTDFGG